MRTVGKRFFKFLCTFVVGIALLVAIAPSRSLAESIEAEVAPEESASEDAVTLVEEDVADDELMDSDDIVKVSMGLERDGTLTASEQDLSTEDANDDDEVELSAQGELRPVAAMGVKFTMFDNGLVWQCREYLADGATDEAVIYGVSSNKLIDNTVHLDIPHTVTKNAGKAYKVVGLISMEEANDVDEVFFAEEDMTEHFFAPGSVHPSADNGYPDADNGSMYYVNDKIETISVPDTVRFISDCTFLHYHKLRSISFWNYSGKLKLERIGQLAFADCTSLKDFSHAESFDDVIIPSSVKTIDAGAFAGCSAIERIGFPTGATFDGSPISDNENLRIIENAPGVIDLSPRVESISFMPGIIRIYNSGDSPSGLTELVIPDGVETVRGFDGCTGLKTVRLPEGIKDAGSFRGCTSLTSINLPVSLEVVPSFYGCKNLHIAVNHPAADYLLDLEYAHSGITSVNLPASLEYLTSYISFSGCKDLESINVASGGKFCSVDGVFCYRDTSTTNSFGYCLFKYPAAKSGSSYTVPSWVKVVYALAFEDCKLSEIHIPVTVTTLDTLYRSELVEQDRNWDGTEGEYGPFDRMASNPTIYYVKNSYADFDIHEDELTGNFKPEPGPPVKITYKLNGGTNAAGNPSTVTGGSSVTLKNPTRSGYTFSGWYNGDTKLSGGVLTPKYSELYNGVTVEARWTGGKPTWSGASKIPVSATADIKVTNGGYIRVKNSSGKWATENAVLKLTAPSTATKRIQGKKAGSTTLYLLDSKGNQVAKKAVTVYAIDGKAYEFQSSVDSSYVLDIQGKSKYNGAQMIVYKRNGGANQRYETFLKSDGTYVIRSVNSRKYLTVESETNKYVKQWAWKGGGNTDQRWRLTVDSANRVTFVNVKTNKCFDVQGGKTKNSAKMIVWQSNGGLNQKWVLNQK